MPIATCQHLHANRRRCGSPALRGEHFCYFHHPTRRPIRRSARCPADAAAPAAAFQLPPIVELEDVQIALCEIMCRVADATLDVKRANLLLDCVDRAARCLQPNGLRSTAGLAPDPTQTPPGSNPDLSPYLNPDRIQT